jgi:hypothetical protein
MEAAGTAYPASLTLDAPEKVANWRPLVHWLLAIPHIVVMYALGIVSEVVGVVSWFAVLFTGKLPEGLAGVQCMCQRYNTRVVTYIAFMHEDYPPFAFGSTSADPGDFPRVRVDYQPALEERNRLTVFFRLLLAIPHFIVIAVLGIGAFICGIIAFFAVLFTGRWPEGLRTYVLGVMRWSMRAQAYLFLLTDEYPPFRLD